MVIRGLVLTAVLLLPASFAWAADNETRTFSILVDGKPAGTHVLNVKGKDSAAQTVTSVADVSVKIGIIRYTYTYRGTETWQEGRLAKLTSTADDNGKKLSVAAEMTAEGLAIHAGGKDVVVKNEPWPTTYWKLPPEKSRTPNVTVIDSDTGKVMAAKMEKVGEERIATCGAEVLCNHYRISGDVAADLWYDGHNRLVRQESQEQGHKTILELTRLQRE